jgi:hypothetical protein
MRTRLLAAALAAMPALAAHAQPLTSAFTYQGRLDSAGSPATGTYDLRFSLFDAGIGGTQLGPTLCVDNLNVANGTFTTHLDFGAQFAGQQRFLEISVRQDTGLDCANGANFTTLTSRQALTAAPNAAFALNADSAATAATATNATNAALLNSQPQAFYLNASNFNAGTLTDARLSANVELLGIPQTITALKTFSTPPTFSVASGAPFSITSATGVVTNLNADMLDGLNSSNFVQTTGVQSISGAKTFGGPTYLNGFVGMGTTTPIGSANLVLSQTTGAFGGMYVNTSGATGEPFYGYAIGGSIVGFHFVDGGDSNKWKLQLAGSPRLTVTTGGAVGVGTTTPGMSLEVTAPSYYGAPALGASFGATKFAYLHVSAGDHSVMWDHSSALRFGTETDRGVGYVEVARFSPNGFFGVGTDPGWKFDVGGTGHFQTGSNVALLGDVLHAVEGDASTSNSIGVLGNDTNTSSGYGVFAGGRMGASGTKSFHIDHPLDPENKYLNHYCEEGPEPLNVYRGTITLDEQGEATVDLPPYFGEINKDPSYTLTAVGAPMPALYVSRKVEGNHFSIAGGAPRGEVCWRVEATRNDRFVRAYGAPVEQDKTGESRGKYLQPALYDQPPEKGQFYRQDPHPRPHGVPHPNNS